MRYRKNENFKRKIEKTCKRYMGQLADKKATIADVAKLFNIAVDESRLQDYIVAVIDYTIPYIEFGDIRNNITYKATWTDHVAWAKLDMDKSVINSVTEISPNMKIERLHYIGSDAPFRSKLTFSEGKYDLCFEKQSVGSPAYGGEDELDIQYLLNMFCNKRPVQQPLLTKMFANHYGSFNYTFEQCFTYRCESFIRYDDEQDKFTYCINNDNVIYAINQLTQKELCDYLHGICFEKRIYSCGRYFPLNMRVEDYPLLEDSSIISAMMFKCGIDGIHHHLEVYKTDEGIKVMHVSERYNEAFPHHREIVDNETFLLPLFDEGSITSRELQNVAATLQIKGNDKAFAELIAAELVTFGKKVDVRKGLAEEELDMLSPKLLFPNSVDEIAAFVGPNIDEYFKLIAEQFRVAANLNDPDAQARVLKPRDSSIEI